MSDAVHYQFLFSIISVTRAVRLGWRTDGTPSGHRLADAHGRPKVIALTGGERHDSVPAQAMLPVTAARSVGIFLRLPVELAAEIDAISEADYRPRTRTIELALWQFVQERKRADQADTTDHQQRPLPPRKRAR
jgi:hypothetical protein